MHTPVLFFSSFVKAGQQISCQRRVLQQCPPRFRNRGHQHCNNLFLTLSCCLMTSPKPFPGRPAIVIQHISSHKASAAISSCRRVIAQYCKDRCLSALFVDNLQELPMTRCLPGRNLRNFYHVYISLWEKSLFCVLAPPTFESILDFNPVIFTIRVQDQARSSRSKERAQKFEACRTQCKETLEKCNSSGTRYGMNTSSREWPSEHGHSKS